MTYYYVREDSNLIALANCVVSDEQISFSLPAGVGSIKNCLIVDDECQLYSVILIRFTGTNGGSQVNGMITLKEMHPRRDLVLDAIRKQGTAHKTDLERL